MKVILAEKPSVARDIARYLKAQNKRDGYLEGNGCQVTWAYGHLVTLKEPHDYAPHMKKWALQTLPFIPEKFGLKTIDKEYTQKQFRVISALFQKAEEIICATDAGREGELIFRYILALSGCLKKPFRRLWLNSLTQEAIAKGFSELKPGKNYDFLYHAARCRSQADWIIGLNATRNYTIRFGQGQILWSIGRVQTPVLSLIVSRDEEIELFEASPFWELRSKYREAIFKYRGKNFKDIGAAQKMLEKVKSHSLSITNIKAKEEKENSPLLYDLTDLQRDMNRRFSYSAAKTLEIAQKLYEGKYITYPRTDSRYLSSSLKKDIPKVLHRVASIHSGVNSLDLKKLAFSSRIVNDKKVTDHHAIIPTGNLPSSLALPEQNVFQAIVTRLIAVFYPPCLKKVTQVDAQINEASFQTKGVVIAQAGWTDLYPKKTTSSKKDKKEDTPPTLPAFEKGEQGPQEAFLKEGKTSPPKAYTENMLLAAMEGAGKLVEDESLKEALKERGLGTPATRASIIETLISRGYIHRHKKNLRTTNAGRYLISLVHNENLKSAELTGHWEHKLKEIESGKYPASSFMKEIEQFVTQLINDSFTSTVNHREWGSCPLCEKPIIQGKKGYGCSGWKEGCSFVLWPEYQGVNISKGQIRELLQKHKTTQLIEIQQEKEKQKIFLILEKNGQIKGLPLENYKPKKAVMRKKP